MLNVVYLVDNLLIYTAAYYKPPFGIPSCIAAKEIITISTNKTPNYTAHIKAKRTGVKTKHFPFCPLIHFYLYCVRLN